MLRQFSLRDVQKNKPTDNQLWPEINQVPMAPAWNSDSLGNPAPHLVVNENDEHVFVAINLDSLSARDLKFQGWGDRLVLLGKVESAEELSLFGRAIILPCDVDFDQMLGTVVNGKLLLKLPKLKVALQEAV